MNLYLGTAHVRVTHYGGGSTNYEVIRLVEADDVEAAKAKFIAFYLAKTVEYSVYYEVVDADVSEVIK